MDNECVDFAKVQGRPRLPALHRGRPAGLSVRSSAIDTALVRLFTARIRLGMFDPPAVVPYSKLDESELDSAAHRSLARRLANESMVLLKNDGVLPLKSPKHIARRRPACRSDRRPARQLQRHADSHGERAGGNEGGVSRTRRSPTSPGHSFSPIEGDPVPRVGAHDT